MNPISAKTFLRTSFKFFKNSLLQTQKSSKINIFQKSYPFTSKSTYHQQLKITMQNAENQNQGPVDIQEVQIDINKPSVCEEDQSQSSGSNGSKKTCLKSRIPEHEVPVIRAECAHMDNFEKIMKNNLRWSEQVLKNNPDFFDKMKNIQTPEFLWIGCSDSRVPANEVVGLKPGELFVHRNVANQAPLSDINVLAVIQYSVEVLKVKDIIVCGHYGCGGVRACFRKHDHGSLESWLSYIRDLKARYRKQFIGHTQQQCEDLLVELNVKQQVYNISRAPIVQKSWKLGQQLRIHGLVYRLEDGILKDLNLTIGSLDQLPEQYRIY